jgi:hypothetical protein
VQLLGIFVVVVEQHSLKQEEKILRSPRRTTVEEKTISKQCNKQEEGHRKKKLTYTALHDNSSSSDHE